MVRTWHTLLGLLWPQDDDQIVDRSTLPTTTFKQTQCLFSYKDISIQTLIKRTKYQADRQAAKQLAGYLDIYLNTLDGEYEIILMPVSYKRWRERGYNHLELICNHSTHKNRVRSNILKKIRHTKQQTQVSKIARTKQQLGTFHCHVEQSRTVPSIVILFDDVITTGATMDAASETLLPHLPPHTKLVRLVIAH